VIYITEVRMIGGGSHEHIESVRWRNPQDGKCGSSSVVTIVSWLGGEKGNIAFVRHGAEDVRVGVVKGEPPYLRTYANQTWNDNLLALPRY
jgi:hypothetical protein